MACRRYSWNSSKPVIGLLLDRAAVCMRTHRAHARGVKTSRREWNDTSAIGRKRNSCVELGADRHGAKHFGRSGKPHSIRVSCKGLLQCLLQRSRVAQDCFRDGSTSPRPQPFRSRYCRGFDLDRLGMGPDDLVQQNHLRAAVAGCTGRIG